MNTSTPRKILNFNQTAEVKKPRFVPHFEDNDYNEQSDTHNMSGIESTIPFDSHGESGYFGQQNSQNGFIDQQEYAQYPESASANFSNGDFFKSNFQECFSILSNQIDAVGSHLSNQLIEIQEQIQSTGRHTSCCQTILKRSYPEKDDQPEQSVYRSPSELPSSTGENPNCEIEIYVGSGDEDSTVNDAKNIVQFDSRPKAVRFLRCPHCLLRRFRHRHALMNHICREHLGRQWSNEMVENSSQILHPYVCGLCSRAFETAASCQNHVRKTHTP